MFTLTFFLSVLAFQSSKWQFIYTVHRKSDKTLDIYILVWAALKACGKSALEGKVSFFGNDFSLLT